MTLSQRRSRIPTGNALKDNPHSSTLTESAACEWSKHGTNQQKGIPHRPNSVEKTMPPSWSLIPQERQQTCVMRLRSGTRRIDQAR
jgi:hypothetical protein